MTLPFPPVLVLPKDWPADNLLSTLTQGHEKSTMSYENLESAFFKGCTIKHSKISDSWLGDCNITNCTLVNCLLMNCHIENSKFETSSIQGGRLFKTSLRGSSLSKGYWARDCNFRKCYVLTGKVVRSEVHISIIATTKVLPKSTNAFVTTESTKKFLSPSEIAKIPGIQTSNIGGCSANSSAFDNCFIAYCLVEDSRLHETKLKGSSTRNCQITKAPLALRRFAPELRAIIFGKVADTHGPTFCNMRRAMWGDQKLVGEVMDICYQRLPLHVSGTPWNLALRKAISKTTLKNVKVLRVSPEIYGETGDEKIYRVVLPDVPEFISSLQQVDHLIIDYTNSSFQMGHFFILARSWLPKLPKAAVKVSVIWPSLHGDRCSISMRWYGTGVARIKEGGDAGFNLKGKDLVKGKHVNGYRWTAEKGKSVVWTQTRR